VNDTSAVTGWPAGTSRPSGMTSTPPTLPAAAPARSYRNGRPAGSAVARCTVTALPVPAAVGPFAVSRKTASRTGRSGTTRTRSVPVTVLRSADRSKVRVIRGRFGSGAAYFAGQPGALVGDGEPPAGAELPPDPVRGACCTVSDAEQEL